MLMEVCTAGTPAVPDGHPEGALVFLRRFGVVVGLLFGLGLVALVVADRAAADSSGDVATQADDPSVVGGLGRLTEPLTRPVVDGVVRPVAEAVVQPVIRPVTSVIAPVLRPVVAVVATPVTSVLEPVLAVAAPVTGPVLSPVLDAAKPLTDATGLAPVANAVVGSGSRKSPAPVDRSLPAPSAVSSAPSWTAPAARVGHEVTSRATVSRAAPVASVHSGQHMSPGSPGPQPGPPTAPVPFAVTGGGVAGGTSGQHGGDAAMLGGAGGVVGQRTSSGRSPPGTIVGTAWFGYDDRDHPS
jgi:hypothetical protein